MVGGVGMDHDDILTMCYVDPLQHAHDHPDTEDMKNFNTEEFRHSILKQCKGKQTCNAFVLNSITGIAPEH